MQTVWAIIIQLTKQFLLSIFPMNTKKKRWRQADSFHFYKSSDDGRPCIYQLFHPCVNVLLQCLVLKITIESINQTIKILVKVWWKRYAMTTLCSYLPATLPNNEFYSRLGWDIKHRYDNEFSFILIKDSAHLLKNFRDN